MRHGKSDWSAPGWSMSAAGDHERPLAPRGVKASRLMGRMLPAIGWRPDAIVASTAVRTRDTAELARGAGFADVPLRLEASLYDAALSTAVELVRGQDDAASTLLVVGHEPTVSELVATCVGGGRVRMVTAAVAAIELEVTRWRNVVAGSGMLRFLLPPRRVAEMLDVGAED
ncbi:MAG: histidine phosphatase family protein [Acidobacteriota bacterium]